MTVELFRTDPYRSEFAAQVVWSGATAVALDQTCFAPGSLRQPVGDIGRLGNHRVVGVVRTSERGLVHQLLPCVGDSSDLVPGQPVVGAIDWPRRYHAMKAHTAQHLIDVALRATHDVAGLTLTGSADGSFGLSIVLASGELDIAAIGDWTTAIIGDDLPIWCTPESGPHQSWVWHLDGHGHRTCEALHICSTGEIGRVDIHSVTESGVRLALHLKVGSGQVQVADGSP